jgi:hypothetical protein
MVLFMTRPVSCIIEKEKIIIFSGLIFLVNTGIFHIAVYIVKKIMNIEIEHG